MKNTSGILLSLLFICLQANGRLPGIEPGAKPNVLLIYTDDQGTYDLNCYGSSDLVTPNLDGLARRGIRLTRMYAPSAICSASRAGLLTGRYPLRAGVPGNVSSQHGEAGMATDEVTIAEVLKQGGYVTGHVGKWHLGYTAATMPNGQGFDSSYGHMGGCIDNYSHFFYWHGPNRHDLWRDGRMIWEDGQYFPDLMVRECCEFVEKHRDERFFLYWAINVPHYPMQGEAKWREHYKGFRSPRRQYAEFVSTMDEKIGHVLAKLDELRLSDNTLVIFQSDHGHSVEERAFHGGGNAGNLRGAKGCLFEGGLRVPAIAVLPGVIPAGEVRDQVACGIDWLPSIAEMCGAELPRHKLDGRSLVSVLRDGSRSPHERLYWHLGRGQRAQWAVREGHWKLLGNPRDVTEQASLSDDDQLLLVNLAEDEGETKNQAASNPGIVARLREYRESVLAGL